MAGEWHATDEMATNDNTVNVVAVNGDMPILKPIARLMFQVSSKAFLAIDGDTGH